MLLLVFFINYKIGSSRLGRSPKAFGECWAVLRDGKFYISKPGQCFGNIGGFVCGSPVRFGGTWLINRKTGLMTKTTSLKACNDQIDNLFISPTITSTIFPKKTPTPISRKSPSPTKIPTPTLKKLDDQVVDVSFNKISNKKFNLVINQINFGANANFTTEIEIIPLVAGDSSSSFYVNNQCNSGDRIEELTLAKAKVIITPDRNNFSIAVTGANSSGVDNFNFLNEDISYYEKGKSIGAILTKTRFDRGDGNSGTISGCFRLP